VKLVDVERGDARLLRLLQLYIHEWTAILPKPDLPGVDGLFVYRDLDDDKMRAMLFLDDATSAPTGFALTKRDERGVAHVEEFFVIAGVRRRGVGARAAAALFARDAKWTLTVREENPRALSFWRSVTTSMRDRQESAERGADGVLRTRISFAVSSATMKAIIIHKYGGVENLELADIAAPKVSPGNVVVKIEAAAVNPIDWKIRKGEMKMVVRVPFPITMGGEYAGTISEVASDVTRLKVGDKVWGCHPHEVGAFAEFIEAPEAAVGVRPAKLDVKEAASLPVGALTSLQALRDKGELKAGQRVLVNGASGSVGIAAVQIAKVLGATVTAVCSEAKFDLVKGAGAAECIDYKKDDFTKLGKKWDIIFDAAATKHFSTCHEALEAHGHYITTISSGGDMVSPVLNPVRSQKSHFIFMKPNAADMDFVRGLVDEGKLKPFVGPVFPLEKAAEAQSLAEAGKATGKVIVTI
jgi:NADPH:quinone reductase-like Zn-dependent oxidoreductase/predicted acetyltransferase